MVPDDVDAKEPLGWTKVMKLEVSIELLFDLLHSLLGLGCNVQIVHIAGHNHLVSIAIEDINTQFTVNFGETNGFHDLAELEIP